MTQNLQQTVFHAEKLRNVVNVGGSSPYHVFVSPGNRIGRIGKAVDSSTHVAANDPDFEAVSSLETGQASPVSWIKRTLSALRSGA